VKKELRKKVETCKTVFLFCALMKYRVHIVCRDTVKKDLRKNSKIFKCIFYMIYYASIVFLYVSAHYVCRKIERKELRKKVDTCKMVVSYASQKYLCVRVS
jgi:hypothetical protein